MTARSPGAFMLSATFHAAIIGVVLLFAMLTDTTDQPPPHVLELVAGAGDNYGATEAPALGTPDGVKLDLPPMPVPQPEPAPAPAPEPTPPPVAVQPVDSPPTPITPAPTPPKATVVPKKAPPTFKQIIQRKVWASEWRAKQQIKKERAEEAKRLRKEELEREQREKAASAKSRRTGSVRVSHIDTQGIVDGVVGGSTANKTGGAGGRAMTASGALLDQYYAMLKERIRNAIDKPPGISDQLEVSIAFHIAPDGHLYGARVSHSSGSTEWDQAVLAAVGQVSMPDQPDHKDDFVELTFRTKDED